MCQCSFALWWLFGTSSVIASYSKEFSIKMPWEGSLHRVGLLRHCMSSPFTGSQVVSRSMSFPFTLRCASTCPSQSLCALHVAFQGFEEDSAQLSVLLSWVCRNKTVAEHILQLEFASKNLASVLLEEAGVYQQEAQRAFEEPAAAHSFTCRYGRCVVATSYQGRINCEKQHPPCQKRPCLFGRCLWWWWVDLCVLRAIWVQSRCWAADRKHCTSHCLPLQIWRHHFNPKLRYRNQTGNNSMAGLWPGSTQSNCRTAQALPGEKGTTWDCIALARWQDGEGAMCLEIEDAKEVGTKDWGKCYYLMAVH